MLPMNPRLVAIAAVALSGSACGEAKIERSRGGDADFGTVVQGKDLAHTFILRNESKVPTRITRIDGCEFCTLAPFDSVLPAGSERPLPMSISTSQMRGPLGRRLEVALVDSGQQRPRLVYFRVRGRVVYPYEITPDNRIYFFGVEGEPRQDTVLLTNYRDAPLQILNVSSTNPRMKATYTTHDKGRRYRFDVRLDSGVPAGQHRGQIVVRTDSPDLKTFVIHTLARLDPIVDAEPRSVTFATIQLARVARSSMLREKTVLVRKHRGKDFKVVRATVDNPMLDVTVEPITVGESYSVRLELNPRRARKGELKGTLTIETNDPTAPTFRIPITGTLL